MHALGFIPAISKSTEKIVTSIFIGLVCAGCSATASYQPNQTEQLALPKDIELRFNQLSTKVYRSPINGKQRPGENLEALIIESINGAEQEILLAVQELSLPRVAVALAAKHKAGVKVKVVVEDQYRKAWSKIHAAGLPPHQQQRLLQLAALADTNNDGQLTASERYNGDAIALLETASVPLKDDTADGSKGSGLMHHKFIVIDQKQVIFGSSNFSNSDIHGDAGAPKTRGNANHLMRINNPTIAQIFKKEFEKLWSNQFGLNKQVATLEEAMVGDTRVQVLFAPHKRNSPENGINLIRETLASAKQKIDLALFVFSAQELTEILEERVNAGVKLRALVDPGFASRSYSELLDIMGVSLAGKNCKTELNNKPWQKPTNAVGIPKLATGDKLHHKVAIIDEKIVISGSFNWSPSAAHSNDETLVILHSAQLARHFTREMERLWGGAILGVSPKLERKIENSIRFCGRVSSITNSKSSK